MEFNLMQSQFIVYQYALKWDSQADLNATPRQVFIKINYVL
jgi:hypothetical protein